MDTHATYSKIKREIDTRLAEFAQSANNGQSILTEAVFCLCTPQSDAHKCWNAAIEVMRLFRSNYLPLDVAEKTLREYGVRFHKTKAMRIHKLFFDDDSLAKLSPTILVSMCTIVGIAKTRDYLAESINGWGLKEASHFLRNIGFSDDVCILDRHILRNLLRLKIINEIPKLSKKKYHEIEQKMIKYAHKIKVPVAALDLVFWYNAKEEIFK
jgi:N-glycosylase/DNA lyase